MNSKLIKLILLSCLVLMVGCKLTLKQKDKSNNMDSEKMSSHEIHNKDNNIASNPSSTRIMNRTELNIIIAYYSDDANAIIRKDMISHSQISKAQAKLLQVGKIIPREIQVIPLPLELEKRLPSLLLNVIRVQVGTRVILMDVKSRRILDIIKI